MLALGTLNMIDGMIRSAGAERLPEKRQVLSTVRRALGMPEDEGPREPARATDAVLSISEAASRLNKAPRTIRWYCDTNVLRGLRSGVSRRLTGIPASEIDAFIARSTQEAER